MNWSDERYVRVYTRDTPDWQCLSFLAQGLFCLILRKVDRAGVLPLGRSGRKAVAIAVGHAHQWPMLEPALDELLADGCLRIEGDMLVVPNFIEAQEAEASDAARAKKYREVRRDLAKAGQKHPSRNVTPRHEDAPPRDGSDTKRDAGDTARDSTVTPSRTVPSLAVPPVPEEKQAAPTRLPGKAEVLRQQYPATTAILEALRADGVEISHATKPEDRAEIERLASALDMATAVAAVKASFARLGKPWMGWHRDALAAARAPVPKTPDAPPVDLAWIDALPPSRQAEIRAAWEQKRADVERTFHPSRVPYVLASAAEGLRAEVSK